MQENSRRKSLRLAIALATLAAFSASAVPAIKNMAVVASANSKLADLPLADLVKMCKGTSKGWPDGKGFVLVLRNPDSPELHGVLQKLFGGGTAEAKTAQVPIRSWQDRPSSTRGPISQSASVRRRPFHSLLAPDSCVPLH